MNTWFSFRFPRSSIIFLYRNLGESVTSFMRVMSAFTRFVLYHLLFIIHENAAFYKFYLVTCKIHCEVLLVSEPCDKHKPLCRFAAIFTAQNMEIMDWWCNDLPLPYPRNSYSWARDPFLQV